MNDDYYFDIESVSGALEELFPTLSAEVREEMLIKLFEHLFVYAKKLLFTTANETILIEEIIANSTGTDEQKELIMEALNSKIASLSVEKRENVSKRMYEELVARGHELYQSLS